MEGTWRPAVATSLSKSGNAALKAVSLTSSCWQTSRATTPAPFTAVADQRKDTYSLQVGDWATLRVVVQVRASLGLRWRPGSEVGGSHTRDGLNRKQQLSKLDQAYYCLFVCSSALARASLLQVTTPGPFVVVAGQPEATFLLQVALDSPTCLHAGQA